MSFATNLKDYMDHINNLSFLFENHFNFWMFFKSIFIYFYQCLSLAFIYIISFKWLTDFIELPAIFKHNYITILDGKNIFEASFETELDKSFFLFLDNSTLNSTTIFTGFINSFFLALPFSVPHLLSIRAFLINGLPAGLWSISGTLLGQILFFGLILFGVEFLVVPFLHFEVLLFIVGLGLLINLIYKMTHNPNMKVLNFSQKKELFDFFKINFILAWVEQVCIYSYFGNLTVTHSSNLLQNSSINNFFLSTFFYLFSLFIGSIIWTIFFGFLILNFRNFLSNKLFFNIPFIALNEKLHYVSLFIITIFCFHNIPYYGFDYLISGPLGFIYEDRTLETIKPKIGYQTKTRFGSSDPPQDLVINSLPFDKVNEVDFTLNPGILKYEQYSLDSEFFWKNRYNLQRFDQNAIASKQISSQIATTKTRTFEMTKYDTLNLESYEQLQKQDFQKKENNIEVLLDSLFRNDIYVSYKNNTLVPSTNSEELTLSKISQVHRQFREKYLSNPVYKALINFDMHSFLNGQIKSANLTGEDELDLFKRRIILQNYLNSIQTYKPLLSQKSYAERVYNQQFKGSLSIVRHFNSIKLNYDLNQINSNNVTKKVLKFDQPKYNEFLDDSKMFLHEELLLDSHQQGYVSEKFKSDSNHFDESFMHYLNLNNTAPLYIGWDGLLRKFLIKIPTLPTQFDSGDTVSEMTNDPIPIYFSFQAWTPFIDQQLNLDQKKRLHLPSVDLSSKELINIKQALNFELTQRSHNNLTKNVTEALKDKTVDSLLNRLPSYDWHWKKKSLDLKFQKYLDLGNALPPKLDGIAWPGINNPGLIQKVNES
jgi:hypothetical protein